MHLILLSGGSGKRLWPLSNDTRSKQFLKALKGPDGNMESMLQRVFRQIENVGGWDSITISASASHKEQIELQLANKKINLVIEPERRNTFPAIALACSYLYSEVGVSKEDTVAILPVDSFVDQPFFQRVAEIERVLNNNNANIVLLGAMPHFPTEKYGYIVPQKVEEETFKGDVCKVKQFKEKPSKDVAIELLEQGALWNCGVFGLKLGYVLDILESKFDSFQTNYSFVFEHFNQLQKNSFDYEVVEKTDSIYAIRYVGAWKDLGTWETFTEEIEDRVSGVAILDDTSPGTHVINEQGIPLVVLGIENAVVVANRDGILVAEKGQTPLLKDIVSQINNRPMYEEKRWGYYSVLEHEVFEQAGEGTENTKVEAITKKLHMVKGKQISYQYHEKRKEIWTIVQGKGILFLEDEKKEVVMGDVIEIDAGMKHGLRAITDIDMIEVQLGSPLTEEDIVRLQMEW